MKHCALKSESVTHSEVFFALANLPYIILETITESNRLYPDYLLVSKTDCSRDSLSRRIIYWIGSIYKCLM